MPFLIQHKCDDLSEPSHYGIFRGGTPEMPLTRVLCPKPSCREEFIILGHEMFSEAHSSEELQGRSIAGMPPGFVIARTRRG